MIIVRVEPVTLASRALQSSAGTALYISRRTFNSLLALIDDRATPRPELAESLPSLNSESWAVFPDGRMETTYRLKPGLTWHDGAPLTAEDFVFSWRVYSTPEFGHVGKPPFHAIDEVTATDSRTVTVRWRLPYPGADTLSARDRELPPLPRHILAEAFERQSADAFGSHSFWTRDYVGAGPFRVERWEPGALLEASAFTDYTLGRPKIDRIRLRFVSDANTALANLLAGDAHAAGDASVAQIVDELKTEWVPKTGGQMVFWPNTLRHTAFQMRPDLLSQRAILDSRVRRALAYAVDKDSINEAVLAGDGIVSDSPIWEGSEWGAATKGPLTKYPLDLRQTERLMAEAGFQKGPDNTYVGSDGRFTGGLGTTAAADFEKEMLILADGWRRAGFDVQEAVMPAAQAQDIQARSSFPTMFTSNTDMGEAALLNLATAAIARPENRWAGGNRGGWSNPEFDRLIEDFNRTLDRSTRVGQVSDMLKLYTSEMPSIPLFFRAQVLAHVPALRGPAVAAPESSYAWDMHVWEFR